jgi:hypothetical protein
MALDAVGVEPWHLTPEQRSELKARVRAPAIRRISRLAPGDEERSWPSARRRELPEMGYPV